MADKSVNVLEPPAEDLFYLSPEAPHHLDPFVTQGDLKPGVNPPAEDRANTLVVQPAHELGLLDTIPDTPLQTAHAPTGQTDLGEDKFPRLAETGQDPTAITGNSDQHISCGR